MSRRRRSPEPADTERQEEAVEPVEEEPQVEEVAAQPDHARGADSADEDGARGADSADEDGARGVDPEAEVEQEEPLAEQWHAALRAPQDEAGEEPPEDEWPAEEPPPPMFGPQPAAPLAGYPPQNGAGPSYYQQTEARFAQLQALLRGSAAEASQQPDPMRLVPFHGRMIPEAMVRLMVEGWLPWRLPPR